MAAKKAAEAGPNQTSSPDTEFEEDQDLRDYLIDSVRSQQRRATDFSQADNDLRRFLAQREAQRRDSDQVHGEAFKKKDVFPKKVFGSVEDVAAGGGPNSDEDLNNGEEDVAHSLPNTDLRKAALAKQTKARKFRIENCDGSLEREDSMEVPSTPVLENPEHQTKWYYKYFLGKYHHNYVGQDSEKSAYVLSILEERSFGKTVHRAILWTKDGPKRLCVNSGSVTVGNKLHPKMVLAHFGAPHKIDKIPREVTHPGIQRDLSSLEKQEGAINFKFGVIYAKGSQILDDELLSNCEGSASFDQFLDLLGQRIRLKGWDKYRGGLDVNRDMTGEYSVYTKFEGHEVMFHVSTLLPFTEDDRQQIERKRHIGNDIVNIIFLDGSLADMARFKPAFIKSNFTHIYALVCYVQDTDAYHISVFSEKSVPLFGPSLPNPAVFINHEDFRRFLLVKLINGEKATYNTDVFSSKREKTYDILLQDMFQQYSTDPPVSVEGASNAATPTGLDGAHKSKEETLQDAFVKLGQTLKLESVLSGEAPSSSQARAAKSPWQPTCIFPEFKHKVLCGDSWANTNLVLGTTGGTFLIVQNRPPVLLFDRSVGMVVQLDVVEPYGIIIFRTERAHSRGDEPSRVYVFRLSDLDEFLEEDDTSFLAENTLNLPIWTPRSKSDLRKDVLEMSKATSLYSLSSKESTYGLWLALAVGKKVIVLHWKHAEEWYALTTDTAEGFEVACELHVSETPMSMTILTAKVHNDPVRILVGTKSFFEVLSPGTPAVKILTLGHGCDGAVSAIEVHEDKNNPRLAPSSISSSAKATKTDVALHEVFLTYNCSSHLQRCAFQSCHTHIVEWNSLPTSVICVFPYVLAFTTDAIEFRSVVNGALLQTMYLPDLTLISAKDDLYFCSTKHPSSVGGQHRKPLFPRGIRESYCIYKIPWILFMGSANHQPHGHHGHHPKAKARIPSRPPGGASLFRTHSSAVANDFRKRSSSSGRETYSAAAIARNRKKEKSKEVKAVVSSVAATVEAATKAIVAKVVAADGVSIASTSLPSSRHSSTGSAGDVPGIEKLKLQTDV